MKSSHRSAHARLEPARGARVVSRTPLLYEAGADPGLDRPAHVRAGSALVTCGSRLAIIQDDASFLALIDARSPSVKSVAFPGDSVRQFDDTRGNKERKLDLEAAFVTPDGRWLVALGSGSSRLRERVVLVDGPDQATPAVSIVNAPELYELLRRERAFSGSELNLEGAALVGRDVVLFQRGNGAPQVSSDGVVPAVDATARVALDPLLRYLHKGGSPPELRDVIGWDLGSIEGHRLTFTDGACHPRGKVAFLACAEASPDATRDGPVSAVAIGAFNDEGSSGELGLILDERGVPLLDKAEGLTFDANDLMCAFVVTDRDSPSIPSELLELRLGEAWLESRT